MGTAKETVIRFLLGYRPVVDDYGTYTLRELGDGVLACLRHQVRFVLRFGRIHLGYLSTPTPDCY